jgi:hypothetical protein
MPFRPDHSTSVARRRISYLSFAAAAGLVAPLAARPALDVPGPIHHGSHSLFVSPRRRTRLVLTSADVWPESLGAAVVLRDNTLIMRLLYAYRRAVHCAADAMVCSTRGTLDCYTGDGVHATACATNVRVLRRVPSEEALLLCAKHTGGSSACGPRRSSI